MGILEGLQQTAALILYLGMVPVFFLSIFKQPIIGVLYVIPLLPIQSVRFLMHAYPLGRSFVDIVLLGVLLGLLLKKQLIMPKGGLAKVALSIALYTYL